MLLGFGAFVLKPALVFQLGASGYHSHFYLTPTVPPLTSLSSVAYLQ